MWYLHHFTKSKGPFLRTVGFVDTLDAGRIRGGIRMVFIISIEPYGRCILADEAPNLAIGWRPWLDNDVSGTTY